ncbi:helix-turn-helix domain-containing protein [Epilithonimonas hungarica]|uniref:Transcriptional regulator, AraC family n=1 Tax=Epilithonimonas hungarica TaxID=454006 RepID=A0A1G7S8Y5_9FLAO|nr:helix-turn-helix domain-containing protein [Epilithonimonas hungarica]SDG19441.1 transcriptional regulator, AraC family [Epilithonimonas hungarica]
MKKEDYGKISIEHFARQLHVNVIAETKDFIVSKSPNDLREHAFDLDHPHILDGIAFVFCVKGNAKVRINLTEHHVCQNTVLIAVPNSIVQILEQSDDLKVEFLFFTFDFISNIRLSTQLGYIVKAVEEQACLHLNDDSFGNLLDVHKLIVKQYQKQHVAYREEVIKNLLYALIYQILQLYASSMDSTTKAQNRNEDIHMRFMALLFENYRTERSVRFYADKLFLTPKHFAKVIKETSGKPVLEWIDEMVIMAAKALLKSSDMTVGQIAFELEFANASFFGSYFRKRVGMTPLQYREK